MKKYVKPDLAYENFELSQNIASCSIDGDDENGDGRYTERANSSDGSACEYDIGVNLFISSANKNCDLDYTIFEDYCYQTSSTGMTYFRS